MIGINHRESTSRTNVPETPVPGSVMAPPSTDTLPDPLRGAASDSKDQHQLQHQEQEQEVGSHLEQSSAPNNDPKSNSLAPMQTSSINDDLVDDSAVVAVSSSETAPLNPASKQSEEPLVEPSEVYAANNTANRDQGAEPLPPLDMDHEEATPSTEAGSAMESQQGDGPQPWAVDAASGDQQQASPKQQQQGMIIVTRPRLKRPPLRPIDLDGVPEKSILKKESAYPFIDQPVRNPLFKSQWLQSTVSKLAVMSGPATPTAYTANSPSMFRKLVTQAAAVTMPATGPTTGPHRPLGPPIFANNERPFSLPVLEHEGSSSSLLSDKSLKRVRFSVGQLTTEHVFHHDDAYESAEESEPLKAHLQTTATPAQPKKLLTTTDGVVVDDNIYTAKEIMNYYVVACNDREELPIDRLVSEMETASSRPSNPLLTTINLSGEPLPRKTLDPISDVLTLEFGLKQLYLDNCSLEDDTLKMLLYSLLLTDTLTVLSIQDNKKIKSTGFKYISVFVKKTKSLKALNVSGIAMDKRSIEFLAHALKVGRLGFGSRLKELRMDRCGLRGNLLEIMAPAIRESNLRHVSMRSNRIGASGGVWIGVLMRDYDDQPNASIPNNNEEQGFRRVFPGISNPELLKRTHGVEELDISDNDLRQGADYVAQTLRRNMSLKSLVMANNNLDPARLTVLADALKLNIGLESLDLSNNRMSGPAITGINALTQKLTYNKTLTKLTLSNTGLQSEGAIALAEFLPETRTLTQLDLTGNDLVDIAGVMALSVSIRMNKSLTCLDMNVPPNDAEFARLSRDILRACIRNMEEKTGTNAGMPSPDDMPTNTIFRQPSPTHIPEPAAASADDRRWLLLEGVAGELYRTRETLSAMEKALNHERAMRRSWLEHFYHMNPVTPIASLEDGDQPREGQEPVLATPTEPVPATPEEKKMMEVAKGVLYRGPPQLEQLYHQSKRHQANIMSLTTRVDNDKALSELDTMYNLLGVFLEAYRSLFALPELPNNFVVGKRTNSLPPLDVVNAFVPASDIADDIDKGLQGGEAQRERGDEEPIVLEVIAQEPDAEPQASFSLEDDDDLDEEVYTNDALIDVRRTSLLAERRTGVTSPALSNENEAEPMKGYRERGLRPTPVKTGDAGRVDGEASPSTLASPLEKLRKAAEEEEGEVLRRGKDLLENGLDHSVVNEALTGEELKVQILAGENN